MNYGLRLFLLSSALGCVALSASAADLPTRKGPATAAIERPLFTWSGIYIGVNAGYSSTVNGDVYFGNQTYRGFFPALGSGATMSGSIGSRGFLAGLQAGYNLQFGSVVAGLETDFQWIPSAGGGGVLQTVVPHPFAGVISTTVAATRKLSSLGTVRGRLGYAVLPQLLVYATGGAAYGGVSYSNILWQNLTAFPATSPGVSGAASSETRVGWTVGGGVEWGFAGNWSVKAEYLHYDLGRAGDLYSGFIYPKASTQVGVNWMTGPRFAGNLVRAGLNYRFDFGAGAIAAQ
jgi:outer membrane immunogenic protein